VPRRERHRQRIARNLLIALVLVVALGALAWNLRDRFFPPTPTQNVAQVTATEPPSVPAVNPDATPPAGTDPSPTQAPLVSNLLATSTPTPENANQGREAVEPADTEANDEPPTATEPAASEPEPAAAAAPVNLEELLPTVAELPVEGLVLTNSGDRTLAAVAGTFGSDEAGAEAEQYLTDLGWSANVFNEFAAEAGTLPLDATNFMSVSIHGFADQASASEALPYFSNVPVAVQGYSDVQADPIGDEIRLLRGVSEDGTTNVTAYIVEGPLLYRIAGSSPAGDPTGHVLQLSEFVINGQ
jgi:hypothetical protein